jgi:hypothetical protein
MEISLDKMVKCDRLGSVEKCEPPRTGSGAFCFWGERKKDFNTEFTEERAQRAQRRKAGDWLKLTRDPSTPAQRTGRTNRATRPDAPEGGAKEKVGSRFAGSG